MIYTYEHSNGGSDNSQTASFPILTRQEAASFARISVRKLDQAKANGELAFIPVGRCIRYKACDINAWLDRKRVEARRN